MGTSRHCDGKLRANDAEAIAVKWVIYDGSFLFPCLLIGAFLCSLFLLFHQLPFFFAIKLAQISNNKRPTARDEISSAIVEKILSLLCFELFFMAGISDVSFRCQKFYDIR